MTLRLNGSTSGYTEIDAPASAGNNTLLLPTGNGSNGNILGTDGAGNLSWVHGRMVRDTAKASTSGTVVDFTGIPSWVKRVTVMFDGVSTSGTSNIQVQLGDSGGVETSGYRGSSMITASSALQTLAMTTGILVYDNGLTAADLSNGVITILNITSNTWVFQGNVALSNTNETRLLAGAKTLSDTLDRIRITTVNGTDTFDAGSINILYEG